MTPSAPGLGANVSGGDSRRRVPGCKATGRRCLTRSDPDAPKRPGHWAQVYNTERPREALSLEVPASRYRASERSYPETLPVIEYAPDVPVRRASLKGVIKFDSRSIRLGRAFRGEPVGVRATPTAGVYEVFYAHQTLGFVGKLWRDQRLFAVSRTL